jgi:hypothetical protein
LLNINKQHFAVLGTYRDANPIAPPTPTAHTNENNDNENESDDDAESTASVNEAAQAVENLAVADADAGNNSFFNTLSIAETLNPLLIQTFTLTE